jgi:glycosyltransferase involved in cell wall biosynthesis
MTPRQTPSDDRGPLRVLFAIAVMPVGGAETLLANLVRRMDPSRFRPELCCLKQLGPLGESLARDIPVHYDLMSRSCRYDVRVLPRLVRLMRRRRFDAVVTVGAGSAMFWPRLAARWARVPVVASALHSTGWPDAVGRLNRILTPLTDAFIAVASEHGRYLVQEERFPAKKVHVIPNGVDTERFRWSASRRARAREQLGCDADTPVCGIVAALRPEKNHELFLQAAARVHNERPDARFVMIGDGEQRERLQQLAGQLGVTDNVQFLGNRSDVADLLPAFDVFSLTSHNEANPVSILEAMASAVPVVATRVGSVAESVVDGLTGYLVDPGDVDALTRHWLALLADGARAREMGTAGREAVCARWSLDRMVEGYQRLIREIFVRKTAAVRRRGARGIFGLHRLRAG